VQESIVNTHDRDNGIFYLDAQTRNTILVQSTTYKGAMGGGKVGKQDG
jgi:hypothetical protein